RPRGRVGPGGREDGDCPGPPRVMSRVEVEGEGAANVLIRLLREYLRPYRTPIMIVVVLQVVQTLATLLLPTLNADIIDTGVINGDTGYILRVGGIMLAVSLAAVLSQGGAVFYGARTATSLGRDVRSALFARVQSFSTREVGQFGTPSLITRTTNDVQQ